MKNINYLFPLLLCFVFLSFQSLKAQTIHDLHNKWAFSGSKTSFFTVKNDTLFFSMINDRFTKQYEPFYFGQPNLDNLQLFPCKAASFNDKLIVAVEVSKNQRSTLFTFLYSNTDSTQIHYIGDVYYNDNRIPNANNNCNLAIPSCVNKLYSVDDFEKIRALKPITEITKDEILEVFKKHDEILKTRCNKCYEGFMGAEINQILIEMGYNPIMKEEWNNTYSFSVSGFDNFMDMEIFKNDEEIQTAFKTYVGNFIENK